MQDIYKEEGSDAAPCSTILKAIEMETLKKKPDFVEAVTLFL